ncbi:tail assembly chaperone gp38 (plasmid) [Rahnella aceris]|uniref:Tail assembly chaperone gp38 n=1 Tax=Rahnella sp. (strain Y9602) TaxID=2703885 RepID=A0A0H3FNY3_RAHSY|nr:tail fiber assembly protein [Rahnella aceris]ADW76593.1 tail assembly chaperone gp38 [Rahnella aceris]
MKSITVDSTGNITGMYLSEDDISPVAGIIAVGLSDDDWKSVGPGYTYVNGSLIPPAAKTPEEVLAEQNAGKVAVNTAKKTELIAAATDRISVLQDAVDLEMATEDEAAALPLWKKYRVLLSRVDVQSPAPIVWPDKPSA